MHDRCRIGLIHMSATNPIEEINYPTMTVSYTVGYVTYPATNPIYRGNLNNSVCHLSCNQSWMGNLNNPVVFLHWDMPPILQTILDGKSQQSCCVPTLWDMPPILQTILDGKSQQSFCVPTPGLNPGYLREGANQS